MLLINVKENNPQKTDSGRISYLVLYNGQNKTCVLIGLGEFVIKDSASFCYGAYVLRISDLVRDIQVSICPLIQRYF